MKYVEKKKEETMNKCKPINNVEELFESSGSLFDEDNTQRGCARGKYIERRHTGYIR